MEKLYNLSEAMVELGQTRQGFYYLKENGWVTPKRDYIEHPV